jgi:hypothetical protein
MQKIVDITTVVFCTTPVVQNPPFRGLESMDYFEIGRVKFIP